MSQVSVLSKWVDGSSWFFWHVAFFRPTLLCSIRKFTYLQKLGVLPSGTLSQTPDIEKFCFGVSIVETCYQFSSRKMDAHSVINWTQNGYSTQQFGNLQLRLCAVPPFSYHLLAIFFPRRSGSEQGCSGAETRCKRCFGKYFGAVTALRQISLATGAGSDFSVESLGRIIIRGVGVSIPAGPGPFSGRGDPLPNPPPARLHAVRGGASSPVAGT